MYIIIKKFLGKIAIQEAVTKGMTFWNGKITGKLHGVTHWDK
jgi:hypothetical protein